MNFLRLLFGLHEPINRRTYVIAGVSLALLKYLMDVAVVYLAAGKFWPPWAYLSPLLALRDQALRPAPEFLLWAMAAYALPFAWVGLTMSVRRALHAGYTPWLGVAFLVPLVNWLVILRLATAPDGVRAETRMDDSDEYLDAVPLNLKVTLLSVGIGVALTMTMVSTSIYILGKYGWTLFIGTPFVVGAVAGFLNARAGRRGKMEAVLTASSAIFLGGVALLLFALEGAICIVMAAAPALVVAGVGALLGRQMWLMGRRGKDSVRHVALVVLALPFLAGAEAMHTPTVVYEVASAVDIDAPPHKVWDHVVNFTELDAPPAWVQKLGIAYPMRATLDGEGVGAVRYCEFSTGPFVEPITLWQPGVRLAFDVQSQPPALRELSPYRNMHPPHLDGYFRSVRGEFRFVELPGGRTRLEGSTWYELDLAPSSYWTLMADFIIHRIHLKVLRHVKVEAEAAR